MRDSTGTSSHLGRITVAGATWTVCEYRPRDGRVFEEMFALDLETTIIEQTLPDHTPDPVLGAAAANNAIYIIPATRLKTFLVSHHGIPWTAHNAAFDLRVLASILSDNSVLYDEVAANRVYDTRLFHQLHTLATAGHPATGYGESTLERCAREHLDIDMPKSLVDADGDDVRTSFGKWRGVPVSAIEKVYIDYLAYDAALTWYLYHNLTDKLLTTLSRAGSAFGFRSTADLCAAIEKWEILTHRIQLQAGVVLEEVEANGMGFDLERKQELATSLRQQYEQLKTDLRKYGYAPGEKGCNNALQRIFAEIDREYPDLKLPLTKTGRYQTNKEVLEELGPYVEFVGLLREFRNTEKLLTTFLDKLTSNRIHSSFGVLTRTGRTSSFGVINMQNLPRDERVRECFVVRPGCVLIIADYKAIELATLAQAATRQFGLYSEMRRAINEGYDLHKMLAAQMLRKDPSEVTSGERQRAKVVNFGKPGGMGDETLKAYAKSAYGLELSEEEVREFSETWFRLFPEMKVFLAEQRDTAYKVAEAFGLTPMAHFQATGDRRFFGVVDGVGEEEQPSGALGAMLRKVLAEESPVTGSGRVYSDGDKEFLWWAVEQRLDIVPEKYHNDVVQRRPSVELSTAVWSLFDRESVMTMTGRLRANATYCAKHNTIFQGLAADGAKLALWRLFRAGYRIVNFVHDEVVVEVPEESDLGKRAEEIRELMIAGMREVVPDVAVDVEYAAAAKWYKAAKAVYDEEGRLVPWEPDQEM